MSYQIHRELADGRWVCARHGGQNCYKCGVDYRWMQPTRPKSRNRAAYSRPHSRPNLESGYYDASSYDYDNYGEELRRPPPPPATPKLVPAFNRLTRGTGRAFPTRFNPPFASIMPLELFCGRFVVYPSYSRYTLQDDPNTILIHTDGACSKNGYDGAQAGYSFWYGQGRNHGRLVQSFRVEQTGPFGDHCRQTSNRAELRAVIAALRQVVTPGGIIRTVVIATDSEYVTNGATKWAKTWVKNGWVGREGPVQNRDMWEALLGEVEYFSDCQIEVKIWSIPRGWNAVADEGAKKALAEPYSLPTWMDRIARDDNGHYMVYM